MCARAVAPGRDRATKKKPKRWREQEEANEKRLGNLMQKQPDEEGRDAKRREENQEIWRKKDKKIRREESVCARRS